MRDSLGFDPERGDPLYKNWPFLIVRDAASGVSAWRFLRQRRRGRIRLRLRARQLLRPLSRL
jgi:alpha-glucosidase